MPEPLVHHIDFTQNPIQLPADFGLLQSVTIEGKPYFKEDPQTGRKIKVVPKEYIVLYPIIEVQYRQTSRYFKRCVYLSNGKMYYIEKQKTVLGIWFDKIFRNTISKMTINYFSKSQIQAHWHE